MNPITEPFFSLLWAGAATTSSGGKEPVELNPGDVVYVAPETEHWHGPRRIPISRISPL